MVVLQKFIKFIMNSWNFGTEEMFMLNKKIIACVGGLIVCVSVIGGVYSHNNVKLINKEATCELGEFFELNPYDYLKGNEKKIASSIIETSKVDIDTLGFYDATITCNKKDYKIKVKVTDTKAPEVTLKKEIKVGVNTPVIIKSIAEKVVDGDRNLKVTYKDHIVTDASIKYDKAYLYGQVACEGAAIMYNEPGEYENVLYVEDSSNHKTEVPFKITVVAGPTIEANDIEAYTLSEIDYLKDVTAHDAEGNDITANIRVKDVSAVNTNVAGEYEAIYTVADNNGVETEKTIKVIIHERESESQGNNSSSIGNTSSTSTENNYSQNTNSDNGGSSYVAPEPQPEAPVIESAYWVEGPSVTNGALTADQKAIIDGYVAKWRNGEYSDIQVDRVISDQFLEWGVSISSGDVGSNDYFWESPERFEGKRQALIYETDVYSYSALYVTTETNDRGKVKVASWRITLR